MAESEAIVLRAFDYGEADRIVTLLCRDGGKVRGIARSARRSRRRFGAGLEPGARGTLIYRERPRSDLAALEGFADARPLATGLDPVLGFAAACVALEASEGLTIEAEPGRGAYELLEGALEALAAGLDPVVVLGCFLRNLVRDAGFGAPPPATARLEPTSSDRAAGWAAIGAGVGAFREATGRDLRSLAVLHQLDASGTA